MRSTDGGGFGGVEEGRRRGGCRLDWLEVLGLRTLGGDVAAAAAGGMHRMGHLTCIGLSVGAASTIGPTGGEMWPLSVPESAVAGKQSQAPTRLHDRITVVPGSPNLQTHLRMRS